MALTKTSTAVGSGAPSGPLGAAGEMLGRYRLQRQLGIGSHGVVYAAFDPRLERQVAIKLLRMVTPSPLHRERLLREARVMARLSHPNVVVVYEVEVVEDRCFVVMELVQGTSLAAWLFTAKPPVLAVLDAFIAAGRGLIAAHAAGIVHRDFKPHNVLRDDRGRVMVTDFGLAREIQPAARASESIEVSDSGTMTGALVGTPAYMAAEQWAGGEITAATDQFAFCVALWEALAGARPYAGHSLDELCENILRGPAELDASRIPRRLRGALIRGLDPDPDRRWPSMAALLAQLERARRRRRRYAGAAGAGLVVAAAWLFAMTPASVPPSPACRAPARDPITVWSPQIAEQLVRITSSAYADVLAAADRDWHGVRGQACQAPLAVREAQLACLDGVLDRLDILRQAYQRMVGRPGEFLKAELVDPAICRKPSLVDVPHLVLAASEDVIQVHHLRVIRTPTGDRALEQLFADPRTTPCARVLTAMVLPLTVADDAQTRARLEVGSSLLDQCGDDRVRADFLLTKAALLGQDNEYIFQQAESAVRRVAQPALVADLAEARRLFASAEGRWDDALREATREVAALGAGGLPRLQSLAGFTQLAIRLARATPDDVALILHDGPILSERRRSVGSPGGAAEVAAVTALARFRAGDVTAHAALLAAWQAMPRAETSPHVVDGEIVDRAGRPVAGARVAASILLMSDPVGIAHPAFDDSFFDEDLRITSSDAHGHFAIPDAIPGSVIGAELADRRSSPSMIASHVRLVLEPTRRLQGTIDLAGTASTTVQLEVIAEDDHTGEALYVAPVSLGGAFALAGVSTRALQLGVATRGRAPLEKRVVRYHIPAASHDVAGLHLAIAGGERQLDVLVHSAVTTTISSAKIYVLSGSYAFTSYRELLRQKAPAYNELVARRVSAARVPPALADHVQSDDLLAGFQSASSGALTVCGVSFPDGSSNSREHYISHADQIVVRCVHASADATYVELALPPQPRLP